MNRRPCPKMLPSEADFVLVGDTSAAWEEVRFVLAFFFQPAIIPACRKSSLARPRQTLKSAFGS